MSNAFIVWQDPESRMWDPVAKLVVSEGQFKLSYTVGSLNKRFPAFPRMSIKGKEYVSSELFPFFKNRLISERRPEFYSLLCWMDMGSSTYDPLELLSISGGAKKTDNFRIVKVPERTDKNKYLVKFFVSGIAYLDDSSKREILTLARGDKLDYSFDSSNKSDSNAVALFRDSGNQRIGYYPKYLNEDLKRLGILGESAKEGKFSPKIYVVKVNPEAPEQYRLLCEVISDWPEGFEPFQSEKYFLLKD